MKKLIVLFAFLPLFAATQNTPGYLGKRFILGYGLNITPSLGLASADEVPGEGSFKIITKNAFDLEYVIHKKYSLVVGLDAFNTYTAEEYNTTIDINLNRIINDQIVIGIGFNLNLNLTMDANSGELYLDAAYSLYPEDQQADLRGQAIRRVQVRDIFYFKFGIGYLL